MASSSSASLLPLVLCFLLAVFLGRPQLLVQAAAKRSAAPAPAPAPPLNLTGILEKAGQYSTLLRLLKETQVGDQLKNQLNNSFDGLTLFAPSDNAFSALKPGTLNSLTAEQQVALVLYHILPRFYTLDMFETASNPVRTQASGNGGGAYTLNITGSNSQANVSTGITQTRVGTALYDTFPLAVYPVDAVLMTRFTTAKPPPSPPPPAALPKDKKAPSGPSTAGGSPAAESVTAPSAASLQGRNLGWGGIAIAVGLLCMRLHL